MEVKGSLRKVAFIDVVDHLGLWNNCNFSVDVKELLYVFQNLDIPVSGECLDLIRKKGEILKFSSIGQAIFGFSMAIVADRYDLVFDILNNGRVYEQAWLSLSTGKFQLWNKISESLMIYFMYAKFSQFNDIKQWLENNNSLLFAYVGNSKCWVSGDDDDIWSICVSGDDKYDITCWKENKYGSILNIVQGILISEKHEISTFQTSLRKKMIDKCF